ncbi:MULTISPECIES: hypothetical protein [unclassified Streptomyces]|uniref:hypothetical protein n=1 Tax=unclassified Streptomyces TaxID=2593676 RepID=UPI0035DFF9F2
MNGPPVTRRRDCRTSSAASGIASADHGGRIPVSFSMSWRKVSSEKVTMPQSVWWISTISRVPSSR